MAKLKQPVKPVKQLISKREYTEIPSLYGNDATLETWAVYIQNLIESYGKDAVLSVDTGYDGISTDIVYKVLETDAQFEARLKNETEQAKKAAIKADAQRVRDLAEYERLKAKFG